MLPSAHVRRLLSGPWRFICFRIFSSRTDGLLGYCRVLSSWCSVALNISGGWAWCHQFQCLHQCLWERLSMGTSFGGISRNHSAATESYPDQFRGSNRWYGFSQLGCDKPAYCADFGLAQSRNLRSYYIQNPNLSFHMRYQGPTKLC